MTPERVAEIATTHAYGCGIDSSGTQLLTYRMGDVERAITLTVNEFAEEVVALIEENAKSYNPLTPSALAAKEQAIRKVRWLKLPEVI